MGRYPADPIFCCIADCGIPAIPIGSGLTDGRGERFLWRIFGLQQPRSKLVSTRRDFSAPAPDWKAPAGNDRPAEFAGSNFDRSVFLSYQAVEVLKTVGQSYAAIPGRSWYLLALSMAGAAIGAVLLGAYFLLRVRSNVEKTLEAKIRGPALANYSGFITAWFVNKDGQRIEIAYPGAGCFLLVKFSATSPGAGRSEAIDLRGGEDAKEVVFKVSIDANDFEVPDHVKTAVAPRKGSVEIRFRVTVPGELGNHAIFVQAFQKTRLVQVVSAMLQVMERV